MPVAENPLSVSVRGTMGVAVPAAVKPANAIVRGTIGVAVPAAVNPASLIVRGPEPDEADEVFGAFFLGPASLAGEEVGAVTAIMPGVTE